MNGQTTKPSSTEGPHCCHYTARGRQCRLAVSDSAARKLLMRPTEPSTGRIDLPTRAA
jgi:hypothetical protein